jgi:cell division protein FtsQ
MGWVAGRLPFFRVRQIELEGVRYLAAAELVAGLGLEEKQSLLVRLGPMERRLEGLAGVTDARVSRRLPGTLRVTVTERVPIAFVPGPAGLIALDREARPLPYDPAVTGIDLPVARSGEPEVLDALDRVRMADSAFYRAVETASRGPRRSIILELGAERVIVRVVPASEDIRAVAAVWRHLAVTARPVAELDARYAGWVVVRRDRT